MKWVDMMECNPEALREHYAGVRALAYNNGQMAQHCRPKSRTNRKLANQMGYLLRQCSMCENAADKRGFSLVA
jgi:hypothetical protein